jgi:hypothetical protein
VRHYGNGDIPSINNNNEKVRKPAEKPPELPLKTSRVIAAATKISSSAYVNVNPAINKENHPLAPSAPQLAPPSDELRPVERNKSKNHRRKMTEEEAIKELG